MIVNPFAVSAFLGEKTLPNTATHSLSASTDSFNFLLDKYLNNTPLTATKKMSERLIKRLNIESPNAYKEEAQKIIHLYLNAFNDLDPSAKESLELLHDEFKTLSLYEIRSKYQTLLKLVLFEKADPLFLNLLKKLYSHDSEMVVQQENQDLEKNIARQFDWTPLYRDEMLRLLAQAQQDQEKQNGIDFNCYVVEHRDLSLFLQLAQEQFAKQEQGPEDAGFRILILVRNDVHYTALDCHFQKHQKSCFILDASQDPKHLSIDSQLRKEGFQVAIAGASENDKIQLDNRSCSIFSFEHLSETSRQAHCFENITQSSQFNPHTRRIAWEALSPPLIANCQSLEFLHNYETNHQLTLEKKIDLSRSETERNLGIEIKLKLYQTIATAILEKNSNASATQIARTHPFAAISMSSLS